MNNILILWLVSMIANVFYLSYIFSVDKKLMNSVNDGGEKGLFILLLLVFIFSPICFMIVCFLGIIKVIRLFLKYKIIKDIHKQLKKIDNSAYTESIKDELKAPLIKSLKEVDKIKV